MGWCGRHLHLGTGTYIQAQAPTYRHLHTGTGTYIQAPTYRHLHTGTCTYIQAQAPTYRHLHTGTGIYIQASTYRHLHTGTYIQAPTYRHLHTGTYIQARVVTKSKNSPSAGVARDHLWFGLVCGNHHVQTVGPSWNGCHHARDVSR